MILILVIALWVPSIAAEEAIPALQRLAHGLATKIDAAVPSSSSDPVVALSFEGDASIRGREERIIQELERMVSSRLEQGLVASRALVLRGDADGRNPWSQSAILVRCVVGVEADTIYLTANLMTMPLSFWDRLLASAPHVVKDHLFVSTAVDAEIQILLGKSRISVAPDHWRLREVLFVHGTVLDLGVGNLDGEGPAELVVLFSDKIEVYTWAAGKPRRLLARDLSRLPEAGVRVRDPVGSLVVADFNADGRAEIFYRLFNLNQGEILSLTGTSLRSVRSLKKVPLCVFRSRQRAQILFGLPDPGTNRYLPQLELTDINRSSGSLFELPSTFVTLRCWQSTNQKTLRSVVVDSQSNLSSLGPAFQPQVLQADVGAGSGLADLDGDQEPEWVLSDSVWPGEQDSIRVLSAGELQWQTQEVQGSVVAISGGDWIGAGKQQAVIAATGQQETGSRIYLLQK